MDRFIVGLVVVVSLCITLTAAAAENAVPDGTIELKGGTIAAGVGPTWSALALS
jgi:hypothetical protein